MIAFAELLERLVFTPSRNAKIALLRRYFATQPDPDRGIGLAAVTGELSFTAAKPGLIRELAATRTDPGAVRLVVRLCRRPGRDRRADVAGRSTNARAAASADVVETLETAPKSALPRHRRRLAGCVRSVGAAWPS